ncbi:hypothetical protein ACFX1Z_025024 [Malus domestica]
MATASTVVGLGNSSLLPSRISLSSGFVKPIVVDNPLRQVKAFGGRKNERKRRRGFEVAQQIVKSLMYHDYFKELYRLKTYHEFIDEIYNQVDHVEPWMIGNYKGPSTALCLLYKFFIVDPNATFSALKKLR